MVYNCIWACIRQNIVIRAHAQNSFWGQNPGTSNLTLNLTLTLIPTVFQVPIPNHVRVTLLHVTITRLGQKSAITFDPKNSTSAITC